MQSRTSLTYLYFVGVGGIGMSALARYYRQKGLIVVGYDKTPSPLTAQLEKEGIAITYDDDLEAIPETIKNDRGRTLVVYTPAIPASNTILKYFMDQGFEVKKRSEVLGMVTRETVNLSVAGTHGKTTTSCMLATIMQYSDKQFSAFLGGISTNLNSNYYYQEGLGHNHYSITEADEFDRSFLRLRPNMAVITSTDADHLDIYKKAEAVHNSYREFANLVSEPGKVFYALNKASGIDGVSYSATDTSANFYAKVGSMSGRGTYFDIMKGNDVLIPDLYLNIPGWHNLENAIGAGLMALESGVSMEAIREGLKNFEGIKRRFEFVVDRPDAVYIDDYAHHPSELKAIIASVRDLYPERRITAVFQPHLFSRTRDFMDDFARELSVVDELIVLPIYPARELPISGVTSEVLVERIGSPSAIHLTKEHLLDHLKEHRPDVLLTLGAGDIDRFVEPLERFMANGN